MTPEQSAAYIMSQSVCALAKLEGMRAENQLHEFAGDKPVHGFDDFLALIEEYGIHHNVVITMFRS